MPDTIQCWLVSFGDRRVRAIAEEQGDDGTPHPIANSSKNISDVNAVLAASSFCPPAWALEPDVLRDQADCVFGVCSLACDGICGGAFAERVLSESQDLQVLYSSHKTLLERAPFLD